ncbi:MAG TPA: hypothetical protein VIK34_02350 [Clostridiaceae bacterium]
MSLKGKASNPLVQNTKMKELIGWFAAVIFPFASIGISGTTGGGAIAALIYFGICGWLMRTIADSGMPYFNPGLKTVIKQLMRLAFVCILFWIVISAEYEFKTYPVLEAAMLVTLFVLPKGVFEQLVTVNLFELAGARVKLMGYAAGIMSSVMMYLLYWDKFIKVSLLGGLVLILFQVILNFFTINIYRKTKDITVCSILQILFNLAVVFFCGFESIPYLVV